jgi:hypothetical protein
MEGQNERGRIVNKETRGDTMRKARASERASEINRKEKFG